MTAILKSLAGCSMVPWPSVPSGAPSGAIEPSGTVSIGSGRAGGDSSEDMSGILAGAKGTLQSEPGMGHVK